MPGHRNGRVTLRASAALAVAGAVLAVVAGRAEHVLVVGTSMLPTLRPGDRLVLLRVPGRPKVGALVVTDDPRVPGRRLVKRAHGVDDRRVDVRGDAATVSTDSRTFGAVPIGAVSSVRAFRYHPADAVGWVRSRDR